MSHDDKECKIWLKSNGNLSLERQQYRHWIKASIFSLAQLQVIEVKGYDSEQVKGMVDQSIRNGMAVSHGFNKQPATSLIQRVEVDGLGLGKSNTMADQPRNDGAIGELICVPTETPGTSKIHHNAANFETVIEELDKELVDNVPTSNALVAEVIRDIKRKEVDEVFLDLMHGSVEMLRESEVVGHENVSASMPPSLGSVEC